MKRGKSPGHDGLSVEHLLHAGLHLPRVLAMFLSLCVVHSYLPPDLMKTLVVPITKKKTGDISDKNNYRPISLATVIAKVFDSLLDAHLSKCFQPHDAQFGFRAGLSTESAILSVKHTVRYYTERSTPVYAVFLDLSKAFDLVSYDLLWEKLEKVSFRPELLAVFRMLLGLPRYCSASGMFADERVDGFPAILRKRCASLLRRVRASGSSILQVVAHSTDCPLMWHLVRVAIGAL
ncbi:uncharacterized protein LOC126381624 [Pectinophora gossypiella]|uniref:uncharacterized protein LOC126381624 n=1 Tax=Pectinophora gossypiella TaxID=13191 RepID=UPI00214EB3B9|nr:uncharacterized protein LOC126381624 [Pectinophora gossypiella]